MLSELEYEEKMKTLRVHMNELDETIQKIDDEFATSTFNSHPAPYSNPQLQQMKENLRKQSEDALARMIELHRRFNSQI